MTKKVIYAFANLTAEIHAPVLTVVYLLVAAAKYYTGREIADFLAGQEIPDGCYILWPKTAVVNTKK